MLWGSECNNRLTLYWQRWWGIRCNPLIRVSTVYVANNELIFSCFPRLFPPSWLLNHTSTAALNRKLVWNPNAACTNRHCGGHVHSARLIYSHMGGLAIREAISARIHVGAVYTNSYQCSINTPLIGQEKLYYYCIMRKIEGGGIEIYI